MCEEQKGMAKKKWSKSHVNF